MPMVHEAAAGPGPAQGSAVVVELLHGRFEALAAREPGRTALVYAPEPGVPRLELTYGELNRRANRLARRLRDLGVGPEQRVAVSVDRTPGMVVALLAILKAGGAYAPLDPAYPRERLALLMEDAHRGLSSPVLLTCRHLASNLPEPSPRTRVLFLEEEDRGDRGEDGEDGSFDGGAGRGNLAYLIFTSGSTGRPKAVAIEHRSAVAMVDWARGVFPPESLAGVLASTSINFDLSVFELFVPLSLGGKVILAENALALARTPAAPEVTLINTVPSAMAELLRMDAMNPMNPMNPILASVRVVNLAGEPLRGALAERIHALGTVEHLWNLYGPSEDTTYSTFSEVLPGTGEPSIGRPLEGTSAYVLDEQGRRIEGPSSEPGELLLAGAGLARGYLNRPELTAERFVPDAFSTVPGERAYRTGDLVRWRPGGELDYLGRIDHQVKIRGFRVELGEIEAALASHPAVRDTAVLAREDTPGEKRLVAYVVPEAEGEATPGALLDFLATRLPDPMLPAAFVFLDEMPLNPNGKIDRGALARIEPVYDRQHGREYVAPQDPVQAALAAIWAEALGVERVGVEDPFLELGGHSLLGTRILLKVRELFGVEVPVRALFEASTIKALAARIESGEPSEPLPPIPRLASPGPVPQSYAQERLWFLSQMLENQAVYHMPYAVRFEGNIGDIDEPALERALQELVRRHEALRTVFRQTDEGALQAVLPFEPAPLRRIDLSREDFARRSEEEARRPFDLERGPVMRYELVRLAPDEHVLLLTLHHIVADGWSMDVLARDLAALYLRGQGESLPELPIQYADFAVWHRGWLESGVVERQVAWWREALDGVPTLLELPLDRPRPALQSFRGARIRVALPRDVDRPLRDLSARRGATPFMALLAGFQALLHRYTGQEDMLVATPIANRVRPEVEPLIGFFTNTLVLRGRPSEEVPFEALLEQARTMALGAYTHQDLPFDKLVEELRIERSLGHNTLAQAAVTIQVPLPRFDLPGLRITMEERHPGATPFDLFLALFEEDSRLAGFLEYATDLFDAATVERLAGQLASLLRGACARPELPIADLPLIGDAEREQLVSGWNDTSTGFPRHALVHDMFAEQVRRAPHAEAVRSASGSMTYSRLDARAEALAGRLRAAGLGPDRLAGVFLERSPEQIVAVLAILEAGGAYVPLDPSWPADRLAFVLAETEASAVVTRGGLRDRLPEGTRKLAMEEDGPGLDEGPRPDSDNLAFVLFTSGSTGRPKGVAVTHRNVARLLKESWFADFRPGDVVLQLAPLAFDASTLEIWGPLLSGGTVVVPPPHALSLDEMGDAFLREKVTVMWLTAGLFHQLAEARPDSFRGLRFLMAGGDVLSPPHVDRVLRENPGLALMNGYGPTESTTFTTGHLMTAPPGADGALPIGRPVSNTQVYLLDRGLRLVPAGGVGELCIGGDGLARGYLDRPDLTAERFVPDPFGPPGGRLYRSGDLARYRQTGEIEFLGRIDQQVKIRGFRIEPGEIETTLCEHPAVAEATVVVQGEGADKRLVAFLVGLAGSEADLRPFLEKRLPGYMVPSAFAWLEALPLNPNGKVDRRALARTALRDERSHDLVEPRTPTEEMVAGILAELLKRDRVGADDDFFDLGGHSLLATRLVSRLSTELGVQLSLRTVFESPTVAGLAAAVESALAGERGVELPPILPRHRRPGEPRPPVPLSFAQERLWFAYQLDPGSPQYNISLSVRLAGRLSVPTLHAALREIVRRHEILRTAYSSEAGRSVQRVLADVPVTLAVGDLRGLPADLREAEAVRLAKEEERLPYRLEEGRVTRFRLLRLSEGDEEDWILTLSVHHIASDGWSTSLLLNELAALYGARTLPALPVQYGDYAVWQRERLQGETLDRLVAWWREALAGAPERIELPADRPRPAAASHRGATRSLTLPAAVVERAQALSRRLGATLFMTLLACFETVLHRVSGQDDLLVGTPVAGRSRAETEPLIGCFINTLVLRSRLDRGEESTFRDFVRRVRGVALGAYVHQDLPFEKLVEGLQAARSLDRNPLFQVMFGLHNAPLEEPALPGLALSLLDHDSDVSLFEVTLGLGEFRGELLGGFQYSADLFDPSTIERWSEHFRVILEAAMDDPDSPIRDLPRIPEPERRQLLAEEPQGSAEDEARRQKEEGQEELRNRVATREGELSERRSGLSDQKRAALAKLMKAKSAKLQAAEEAPRASIPKRSGAGPARLSFGQERLWFLDRLEPGTNLYNVTSALRLDGRLDAGAFQRSLDEVVRRHEALRTVFPEIDGGPKQVVLPPAPLALRQADLRHVPAGRRLAELRSLVEQHDRMSFDLVGGPLVRGVLARLSEDSRALILTFHHIACDGLSFGVLVRELGALYSAFSQGRPSPLPELPIQYADYAEWQRERLQGEGLAAQLDWWKRELDGAPTQLELPTDRPRPPVPTTRGAGLWRSFPGLGSAMAALRQQEGATSFMLLLAGFQALLGRYTGQDDLLVGSPVADRPRPETEALIGFFVNTLVLRGRLAGPGGFRGLLTRTRESVLGAFAHQDLPFEKLVDELGEGRDLSRTPLFQVSFSVLTGAASAGAMELPGLTLAPVDFEITSAKFELSVGLEEKPSGDLDAAIQVNADLFDLATAERLLQHFAVLLAGALADPGRSLEDLPLLTPEEKSQILEEWAGASVPFEDVPVHRLFEEQAARNPDALAVVSGDRRLTYGGLDRGADRLADRLRGLGVGPESVVAVCLERSPGQVLAILAVLKAGGAYLPLDPSNPAERLLYTLRDSGALAVLTSEELAGELAPAGVPAIFLEDGDGSVGVRHAAPLSGENLAYVIYTSGSTGNPKGTELRHSGLANLVAWHRRAYGLTPDDRCALLAGSGFDASVWEIWPALASGASLHVPPADIVASPPDLWSWMAEEGITITFLPTPLAEAVMAEVTEPVPDRLALRTILAGGDRLLRRPRPEHPFALVNHYGPTESTVVTNAGAVLREGDRPPAIGRSIDNIRVFLLDRAFRPVPVGVPGELCVAGAGLARGYRHRPELTAAAFVPDPFGAPGDRLYRTGDLVRWLPDGDVEFLGRIDHQIKIRGFRIELGEIEAALVDLPEVREAVVLVDPGAGEKGDKHLVAYLTPREGMSLPALHALRETLSARLPSYMVPSAFVALESMPLNASGKVDRKALARIKPGPEPEAEAVAVHFSPTEEMLAGIWSELLGVERIRPSADFFDLGGHSLLATRLVSRLRESFGVELPLRVVFQTPRLDALARRVEEALREAGGSIGAMAPPILPLSAEERGPWPPLSFAQERLWFLDRLEPGGVLYNVPSALRATGRLDVAALEAALNEIVRRHESLRTTFGQHEGQPFQAVAPELRVPVPVVDLTGLPEERREAEARLALGAEAAQPFDLLRGPLLRALLVRAGQDDWAMLLNLHHIVSDGWSVGVLTGETAALYRAFLEGRPSPLPPLPVQYADYAAWQRQWLRGEVLEAQISYWRERLQGVRTVLDLPTGRPRPPVQSFRGGHRPMRLPAPVPQALRTAARESGATLFMALLAGLHAILHRYTGQEDILVGSPVANRTRSEVEGLIGFFVNALVLRGEFRSPSPIQQGITFRQLLGRVRTAALGAYAHQDLPFERLVDELKIERSLARNPVFQVVFTFNTPSRPLELPGLVLSPLSTEGASAKVDLLLGITEPETGRSDTLEGSWEYSADLFDPSTVDRLSDHMAILLGAAAENPDRPLSELPLLSASERDQILVQWNDTATPEAGCCLHHLFEAWAERRPEATAVIFDERTMTYGELDARSERLADHLRSLGIGGPGREDLVGISLERGIERIVAVLGVFKAGGAYVPLDPSHPRERLSWMLEDSRARVLITESRLLDALPDHGARVVCLDQDGWESRTTSAAHTAGSGAGPDHLAYVIYTSGSTGRPNGVLVRHGAAVNLIREAVGHFGVTSESRLLQSVSFSFDASVLETWTALSSGAALCVARQETLLSGDALAAMIGRDGVTVAVLTPSVLNSLPAEGMPTLEVVSVGGESCPGELASRWSPPGSILRRLLNCYGPTETTIYTTLHVCSGTYRKEPPIGRPVGGTRAYVLDFHGQPAPAGVPGALWIGGAGLARGYLNRPELTAERFAPDPFAVEGERLYRTGDLARWNADGELEFLGRIDRQVKIRGLRIELGEIEAALGSHPRLREYAVLVREDGRGGKRLAAFVVPAPVEPDEDLPPLAAQDLREHLHGRLPDYMVPGSFTFLEALPRTPTDKIDRAALLRLDPAADEHAGAERVEPRDVVELELVRIWQEVLGVPRVGVRDNFFEAGGHSLLAVRLMAQIRQRFGRELPLSILFQGGTIEQMATLLRSGESGEGPSSLVPIQPAGSRPPLFCVHPAGGDVLCFAALARHLGPDQPFYGFQSRGLAGAEPPLARIEDMAAHYIGEMRGAQPEGPYRIGGWSLGGVVAFEMARQLREQGEGVALLAILDSVPDLTAEAAGFQSDIDFLLDMAAYVESLWGRTLGLTRADLERLDSEAQLEVFAERLRGADFLPPGAGVEQLTRILRVYKANANAAGSYEPRPYPGGLTLIRAADMPPVEEGPLSEPDLGWSRVVEGPVEIVPVPGQHLTILAEPYVEGLARELDERLSRVDKSR